MDLVSEPVQIIIPTNIFDDKDPSLSDKSGGRYIQLASAHTQYGVAFIIKYFDQATRNCNKLDRGIIMLFYPQPRNKNRPSYPYTTSVIG